MDIIVEYIVNLFDALIAVFFILRFDKANFRATKLSIPTVAILFAVSTAFLYINDFSILQTIIIFVVLEVFSLCTRQSGLVARIISPIIFEITLICVNSAVVLALGSIADIAISDIAAAGSNVRYLYLLLCKLVMTSILLIILRFADFDKKYGAIDLLLYLFFPVVSIAALFTYIKIAITYDLSNLSYLVLFVSLGIAAINFVTLLLFNRTMTNATAKFELDMIHNARESEQRKYKEIGELYDKYRTLKHDYDKHLMYIGVLAESQDINKIKEYVSNSRKEALKYKRVFHTNCRIIDYVLNSKLTGENVSSIVTGVIADIGNIDELDLATLLGNMLDNALESGEASENKEIEVIFSVKNNYQGITCKNRVAHPVLRDNPELKTSKKDKDNHGVGIGSMKSIVDKYNGLIEFYDEDNKFCVHIALPMNE